MILVIISSKAHNTPVTGYCHKLSFHCYSYLVVFVCFVFVFNKELMVNTQGSGGAERVDCRTPKLSFGFSFSNLWPCLTYLFLATLENDISRKDPGFQ